MAIAVAAATSAQARLDASPHLSSSSTGSPTASRHLSISARLKNWPPKSRNRGSRKSLPPPREYKLGGSGNIGYRSSSDDESEDSSSASSSASSSSRGRSRLNLSQWGYECSDEFKALFHRSGDEARELVLCVPSQFFAVHCNVILGRLNHCTRHLVTKERIDTRYQKRQRRMQVHRALPPGGHSDERIRKVPGFSNYEDHGPPSNQVPKTQLLYMSLESTLSSSGSAEKMLKQRDAFAVAWAKLGRLALRLMDEKNELEQKLRRFDHIVALSRAPMQVGNHYSENMHLDEFLTAILTVEEDKKESNSISDEIKKTIVQTEVDRDSPPAPRHAISSSQKPSENVLENENNVNPTYTSSTSASTPPTSAASSVSTSTKQNVIPTSSSSSSDPFLRGIAVAAAAATSGLAKLDASSSSSRTTTTTSAALTSTKKNVIPTSTSSTSASTPPTSAALTVSSIHPKQVENRQSTTSATSISTARKRQSTTSSIATPAATAQSSSSSTSASPAADAKRRRTEVFVPLAMASASTSLLETEIARREEQVRTLNQETVVMRGYLEEDRKIKASLAQAYQREQDMKEFGRIVKQEKGFDFIAEFERYTTWKSNSDTTFSFSPSFLSSSPSVVVAQGASVQFSSAPSTSAAFASAPSTESTSVRHVGLGVARVVEDLTADS